MRTAHAHGSDCATGPNGCSRGLFDWDLGADVVGSLLSRKCSLAHAMPHYVNAVHCIVWLSRTSCSSQGASDLTSALLLGARPSKLQSLITRQRRSKMKTWSSSILLLLAAGVSGYAPRPSAFARPRLAVRAHNRAALSLAADEAFDLFTPEPELPPAQPVRQYSRGSSGASPLRALRRSVARLMASLLATLLSNFFFGAQAFAATSNAATKSAAVGTLSPVVGGVVAAAGLSAAIFASRKMAAEKREAEAAAAAQALADSEPPKLDPDALLMSSLRTRMLNLGKEHTDAAAADAQASGEEGAIMDDELDDLERSVREQRSRYPVNSSADRGNTATLEPPRDSADEAGDDVAAPAAAEAPSNGPKMADAATVALLEKLFNSGGDGAPEQ